jgi:purine-nucleoside phosphorylase
MTADVDAAIATLACRGVKTLPPLAFVLGSGLGVLADEAEDAISIPYAEIPGFPQPSVAGHKGRLVVGTLEGTRVALFQGRGHYYERGDPRAMATAIETLARLGGHPGDERFVPLTRAYDPGLLATLRRAAKTAEVKLHEGVYMWFNGPSFETPAEIRMAKILGADLVGMSTVPEVILARLHGLNCVAVSLVTNFAAGLSGGDPSHEETQEFARRGSERFRKLLRAFVLAHGDAGA